MSKLLKLIQALLPKIEPQHVRDEAYLAGAVDICDLERRIHEVDLRGRGGFLEPMLAVGMR